MSEIYIKKGDTARKIADTLLLNGAPINLTGASVNLVWRVHGGATTKPAAVLVDAAAGKVEYQLLAGDVAAAASVTLEWEITFPGGAVLTVPTRDEYVLRILPDNG